MTLLYDLPDEVLLEIVHVLSAIRSFETQSKAFVRKRIEKDRQRENHLRQKSLHALCLTSHRFRYLSLPTLYESSTTCATQKGLRQLELLHRTLRNPDNGLYHPKRLSQYILYVENRLADYEGNSLDDDEHFQDEHLTTYLQHLATLTQLAVNMEHLCVVSLELNEIGFWSHVLNDTRSSNVGIYTKLGCLSAQIHAFPWVQGADLPAPQRLLEFFCLLPSVSELRVSGAMSVPNSGLEFRPGEMQSIQRLDLIESNVDMYEVADLLLACPNLRDFTCEWHYVRDIDVGPSVLHDALLARGDTLKNLTLDWGELRSDWAPAPDSSMLGSLRSMKRLESLVISELGFLSDRRSVMEAPSQLVEFALSSLLPESLGQFTLLTSGVGDPTHGGLNSAPFLWQFANECNASVPHLETLRFVVDYDGVESATIGKAFKKAGVQLRVETHRLYQSRSPATDL